jgi:hypothetical protein
MKQFEKWQEYWDKYLFNKYGKEKVTSEEDLFFQVARTWQKKPIEKEVIDDIVKRIISDLHLSGNDILVDFCCGNGLFTYDLKDHAKQIIGVDFSESIIDTAHKYRSAANITYCVGDVIGFLENFKQQWPGIIPGKYLMNDALAYFTTDELEQVLGYIKDISPQFIFLLRGVPNEDLKWNFYNTEERKAVYYANIAKGDLTNDGLGSWWSPADIENICGKMGLQCVINNQQPPISDYRMDIIISTGK